MATPLHKMILPYNRYRQTFPFKYPIRTPITATKLSFPWLKRRKDRELTCIKGRVSSKNDGYTITELEREKDKEDNEEIIIGKEGKRKLADTWLEIHGVDDWEGLLDPLDPLLRSELIRYGEMAQACYDAFDSEVFSKYCGSCKYTPTKFFECLELMQHGYEVTSYLYASCNINLPDLFQRSVFPEAWSKTANWIGYVAVSNDKMSAHLGRRDITIAWRGTMTRLEWIEDFMYFLKPISLRKIRCPDPRVRVESGFLDLYTNKNKSCRFCKHSAREQILAEVKRLIKQYKDENLSITITGHSLGSALAILSGYDIAEAGIDIMDSGKVVPTCVFSFSGPRVGNIRFKERLEELGVKILRVVNIHDKVPQTPGIFFNEHIPPALQKLGEMSLWLYSHVGVELALDHRESPFLKETSDLGCLHNLEAHLHLLDGYHGKGKRFALTSRRDIALVNKEADFLKNHFLIPPNWRQSENKGLVKNHEGHWVQPEQPNPRNHL